MLAICALGKPWARGSNLSFTFHSTPQTYLCLYLIAFWTISISGILRTSWQRAPQIKEKAVNSCSFSSFQSQTRFLIALLYSANMKPSKYSPPSHYFCFYFISSYKSSQFFVFAEFLRFELNSPSKKVILNLSLENVLILLFRTELLKLGSCFLVIPEVAGAHLYQDRA